MAQVTVSIKVNSNAKEVYIVGSTKNLGAWDAKAAVLAKDGVVSKRFEEGTKVEFKVLAAKSWDAVEKGVNGEELENHAFVATNDVKQFEINVANYNA